jgi:hypothetical protein
MAEMADATVTAKYVLSVIGEILCDIDRRKINKSSEVREAYSEAAKIICGHFCAASPETVSGWAKDLRSLKRRSRLPAKP